MTDQLLFLGIDGGGTKTEAVVIDGDEKIIGRGLAAGSNPHNFNPEIAVQNIIAAIKNTNVSPDNFQATCLGIAGLDSQSDIDAFTQYVASHLHSKALLLHNDGYIGFRSGSNAPEGICLIASTGSNCFGICSDGSHVSAGDWGYLLGDQGSGFHLGQTLLQHAIKEYDGRQPRTRLLPRVYAHFQIDSVVSLSRLLYIDKPPIDRIAGLAQIISEPDFIDDPFITRATQQTVDNLFEAFQAVIQQLNSTTSLPVVLVGKLFRATALITTPLTQKITTRFPQCQIIVPTISPATAAAKIAATLPPRP